MDTHPLHAHPIIGLPDSTHKPPTRPRRSNPPVAHRDQINPSLTRSRVKSTHFFVHRPLINNEATNNDNIRVGTLAPNPPRPRTHPAPLSTFWPRKMDNGNQLQGPIHGYRDRRPEPDTRTHGSDECSYVCCLRDRNR